MLYDTLWESVRWMVILFQGEDGIRHGVVSGVQLCANSISPWMVCPAEWVSTSSPVLLPVMTLALLGLFASVTRSEERRVGKSVDLGGRRIIKKKKDSDSSM